MNATPASQETGGGMPPANPPGLTQSPRAEFALDPLLGDFGLTEGMTGPAQRSSRLKSTIAPRPHAALAAPQSPVSAHKVSMT
ncbi:hypothetical protein CFP75_21535 [Amycolatopsis alba DSM 44262]|uniref:Uncharacterized protein n=1 Tax=Amycolatopsis alba DSM 44262 TaxID=1125972 RepID=A0A229RPM9_AMYAL|nr:hypothetical protein CFP75_21535 [Amycolatopsis alba DSM 44262]